MSYPHLCQRSVQYSTVQREDLDGPGPRSAASPEPAAGCRHQPAANQPHHHQRCDPSLCAALSLCVPCVRAAEQASSSRLSRGTRQTTGHL